MRFSWFVPLCVALNDGAGSDDTVVTGVVSVNGGVTLQTKHETSALVEKPPAPPAPPVLAFMLLDTDDSGTISKQEVQEVFLALGKLPTEAELREAMNDVDVDLDGAIDEAEFLAFVRRGFESVDEDDDGSVSMAELDRLTRALGQFRTPDELATVRKNADDDKNGLIDFEEFLKLLGTLIFNWKQQQRHEVLLAEAKEIADGHIVFNRRAKYLATLVWTICMTTCAVYCHAIVSCEPDKLPVRRPLRRAAKKVVRAARSVLYYMILPRSLVFRKFRK